MSYLFVFLKSIFILNTLLLTNLSNRFFLLKILCFFLSIPYLFIGLAKSFIYKKPLLIVSIQDFGIGAIKLGQFLSTRTDIVGEKIANILQNLQENLKPCKLSTISDIIPNNIILCDEKAIATASIAQVYCGKLITGELVAIKIIKPNIIKQIKLQTKIMYFFGLLLTLFSKKFRKLKILDMITEISRYLLKETDLQMEAAVMDHFAKRFIDNNNIKIPQIYWEFIKPNILVSEWINGFSLNKTEELNKLTILEKKEIATNLLLFFLTQIYQDGVFQADPHQGNIIIMENRKIAIVDFGRVGYLEKREKMFISQILHYFLIKDYTKVAQLHRKAGYVPEDVDLFEFEMSCRVMGEKFIGKNPNQIKIADTLNQILNAALQFGMQTQKSLILFQKTIAMLEGVLFFLDPTLNAWDVAKPWIADHIKQEHSYKNIIKDKIEIIKEKIINFIV